MMKTSGEGKALIKKFEGCELQAYQCSANVWTIGYGHTRDVSEGDSCSQEEADTMLAEDLEEFEGYVNDLVQTELSQNQFDALVAWTYNLGPTNLKASTLLQRLNEGDLADAPHQIRRWNKAGGQVLDGLIRRREAEALLFTGEAWEDV
jgi:lysozyme